MTTKLVLGAAVAALAAAGSLGGNTGFAQTPPPPGQPQQQQQPSGTPGGTPTGTPLAKPDQQGAQQSQKDQQSASDWRSSKIVGVTVYNGAGENIGEVDDLILASDGRIQNAVLGVGGFLGMGEKLVAVPFSDLKMSRDDRGNIHLVLNSSRETLQSAPEFHYRGDKNR